MKIAFFVILVFLSSMVQRVSGFGFGIVMLGFMPFMFAYQDTLIIVSILSIIVCLVAFVGIYKDARYSLLLYPMIFYITSNIICVKFLKDNLQADWRSVLGIVLILVGLFFAFVMKNISLKANKKYGALFGLLSGCLGGLFGVGGPPMILYVLSLQDVTPKEYIATVQLFGLTSCTIDFIIKASYGLVVSEVYIWVLYGIIPLILGIYLGGKIYGRMSAESIKRIVYMIIIADGLMLTFL